MIYAFAGRPVQRDVDADLGEAARDRGVEPSSLGSPPLPCGPAAHIMPVRIPMRFAPIAFLAKGWPLFGLCFVYPEPTSIRG